MEYYIYKGEDELFHYGTRGMKWGIRRYQNKDGSLTPAGKKRLKKETEALKKEEAVIKNFKSTKAKFDRLDNKRRSLEEQKKMLDGKPKDEPPVKKTIKEMTNKEIQDEINRLNLEKSYKDALKANAPEVTVSRGKKFVNVLSDKLLDSFAEKSANVVSDLTAQTLKSIGAKYINETLVKKFGDSVEKVYTNNKK